MTLINQVGWDNHGNSIWWDLGSRTSASAGFEPRAVSGCWAKTKLNCRSYKILGAADWKKLKLEFLPVFIFWSFFDHFLHFSIFLSFHFIVSLPIFFNCVFVFVPLLFFVIVIFLLYLFGIVHLFSDCFLNGSFIFSPSPGNLCNFDACYACSFVCFFLGSLHWLSHIP